MPKDLPKEIQEKLAQLQLLQQRLAIFSAQKQQLQLAQAEAENALSELKEAKGAAFQLIGEILIEKDSKTLQSELKDKLEELKTRIDAIEKQEKASRDKGMILQKEVLPHLKE